MENTMLVRGVLSVVAILVLWLLVSHYTAVSERRVENFDTPTSNLPGAACPPGTQCGADGSRDIVNDQAYNDAAVKPSEPLLNEQYRAVDYRVDNRLPADCFPADRLTATDLLPAADAVDSKWAQVNPAGQGDVNGPNMLSAGYNLGVDTIGQSLRNPSYDLRSDVPNPQDSVGPWNNSTITPDMSRRPLTIGGAA